MNLNKKLSALLEDKITSKDIKMAAGVAKDKRYAGGNMTGAVNVINKIKPGLASHPKVEKELRKANEDTQKSFFAFRDQLAEKHLTPAEMKKREEIAKAMDRENPSMPMGKKMAIATATAKKVAEQVDQIDELSKDTIKSYMDRVTDPKIASKRGSTQTGVPKSVKSIGGMTKAIRKVYVDKANEEVDQIDELKRSTLASYAKKATDDVSYHSFSAGTLSATDPDRLKVDKKAMTRQAGVSKAIDRLAKEEVEGMAEGQHYCAKHVYSNIFGEGVVVEGMHAEPDQGGNIEWYAVEFKDGVKKVYTENLEIMIAEYHMNHSPKKNKKKMG